MHGCILVYMTELCPVQRKEKAMANLRRQKLESVACKTTKLPVWSNKGRRLVNVLTNICTGCCCLQNDFKIMIRVEMPMKWAEQDLCPNERSKE